MTNRLKPEAKVLRDCLALLEKLGIPAWRSNSGGVAGTYISKRTGKTTKRFIKFAGIEGLSDITGIIPQCLNREETIQRGVFLAVECKAGANTPTDKQVAYLQMINRNGGIALVVYSAEELLKDLKEEGVQV